MADRDAAGGANGQAGTILRVVVSAERIRRRVDELAASVAQCYQGRELVVLAVMTGDSARLNPPPLPASV